MAQSRNEATREPREGTEGASWDQGFLVCSQVTCSWGTREVATFAGDSKLFQGWGSSEMTSPNW